MYTLPHHLLACSQSECDRLALSPHSSLLAPVIAGRSIVYIASLGLGMQLAALSSSRFYSSVVVIHQRHLISACSASTAPKREKTRINALRAGLPDERSWCDPRTLLSPHHHPIIRHRSLPPLSPLQYLISQSLWWWHFWKARNDLHITLVNEFLQYR